jgi:predicted O-methyltransferase YrrM
VLVDLIPPEVKTVMARLEEADARDRVDGTPYFDRLRSVDPETARFLHLLVLATGACLVVELGASSGYSALWMATAVRANGGRLVTFEVDERKLGIAAATFADAAVADVVELRAQDAHVGLAAFDGEADVVFIDHEKVLYEAALEPSVRALRLGGLLVADNTTSHEDADAGFCAAALSHPKLIAHLVTFGRGQLLAVKVAT